MKRKSINPNILGFVFVSIIGTVNHFVFEWSNESVIAGIFTPINESSWEHLKLIFFPYLVFSIIQYSFFGKSKSLAFSKAIGVTVGMATILAIFYTYSGIIGKNIDTINILSFFIGVSVAFLVDSKMQKSSTFDDLYYNVIGISLFVLLTIMFVLFTFAPPLIPLFKDPISDTYGI